MTNNQPKLLQTYLPDGTLEGIRIIEVSGSSVKAMVVPRIKLSDIKDRPESKQPALYFLINSADNQLYIGESENFFYRIKNHDQSKDFWDVAVAIVSNTNTLEKSDVKYLESLAVEKAQSSAAMQVLNKTVLARNTIHEFKLHTLEAILADASLIAELLGYSIFKSNAEQDNPDIWLCKTKLTNAQAEFRGGKFVVLAGSVIDKTTAPSWASEHPKTVAERNEMFEKYGIDRGDSIELKENISFKSPNHAGGIVTGRSINAWTTWKNTDGRTMDEVMR
jgi:Domain of unknown function (DUF4357)